MIEYYFFDKISNVLKAIKNILVGLYMFTFLLPLYLKDHSFYVFGVTMALVVELVSDD